MMAQVEHATLCESGGTTYEWNIRARLVNNSGVTICQSLWSDSDQFTTLPTCNNLENLNVNSEANVVL